jgi:hypothetical protein
MTHISAQTETGLPSDVNADPSLPVLEGIAHNGVIVDVVFPFYTGVAGLRDRGEGRVEFAFFRRPPFRFWRETSVDGMICGERYRVIGSNVSETTKAMVVVIAQKI